MALRTGGEWPSVTEVLQLCGLIDLSMIPSSTLEKAKSRGLYVHRTLELLDKGEPYDVGRDTEPYVSAYHQFRSDTGFRPERIESKVQNDTHRYDGVLDRTGTMHGRDVLIDLKCVYRIHHTTALQTAGYALCLLKHHERYALQLCPDGSYTLTQFTDRSDKSDFLAAVRLAHYRLRHEGELPWLAI